MEELFLILAIIVGIAVGLAIYFAPTIVAFKKGQQNKLSIFLLNLFLGWSLIGWVVALVWATKNDEKVQVINNNYASPKE